MAHTKSARKRIRQDRKRHVRNQAVKTRIKGLTKKFRASLSGSDAEQSSQALKESIQAIDKAASKGVVHHRTASRKISRLARAAHRAQSASEAKTPSAAS